MDDFDSHALGMGRILANLQAIESILRLTLYELGGEVGGLPEFGEKIAGLNRVTEFSSMGELVKDYNKLAKKLDTKMEVNWEIVELRDALAHGRIWQKEGDKYLRIIKFGKQDKNGKVKVEYDAYMSPDWHVKGLRMATIEMKKIVAFSKANGMKRIKKYPV